MLLTQGPVFHHNIVVGEGYQAVLLVVAVSEGLTRPVCRSLLTKISQSRSGPDLTGISMTRPDQWIQERVEEDRGYYQTNTT